MDLLQRAREIVKHTRYITIATSTSSGEPWNTPVSAFHDDDYNFYWASWVENQHSKNIRDNPNIFIVIYDSTAPEGTGEGVYIRAKAYELNSPGEVEQALFFRNKKTPREAREYLGTYPRRLYKAVPEKFWINGDGDVNGEFVDVRFEINHLKNK